MDNLTIIIPFRDGREALARLLPTLPPGIPAIVVDDCSGVLPEVPDGIQVIRLPERGYFAGACNAGIAACTTDVLILNQDLWFHGHGWLSQLDALRQTYAVIGDGVAGHPAWPNGYVQGTLMYMRRDAIEAVGVFDAKNWPLWGCTAEWQARACRRGFLAKPMPGLQWFQHERREDSPYGKAITRLLLDNPRQRDRFIRTPPLVSVVVPCYNYGRYLGDVLGCLFGGETSIGREPGQTFQGFEVIIVDDASTDGTAATVDGLADAWKGVRVLHMARNAGTAATLNAGIKAARGRYIQVLSADDMLEPTCLEKHLAAVEANPTLLVYSDVRIFNHKRGDTWAMPEYDFDNLLTRNHVPAGTMFTRAAWEGRGGYPEEFARGREDWAFAVAMGRAGYCGQRVPEPLYLYRREGQNRSLHNTTPLDRGTWLGQLRTRFPDLYGGDRPMGCCGKGRKVIAARQPAGRVMAAGVASRTGEKGMTLLEYIGVNVGRTIWYGSVTNTRYVFSNGHRVSYVDDRDVAGMLDIMYDRRPAFRVHMQPKPVAAKEVAPPVAEPESAGIVEPEPVAEPVAEVVAEVEVVTMPDKPKRAYKRRVLRA